MFSCFFPLLEQECSPCSSGCRIWGMTHGSSSPPFQKDVQSQTHSLLLSHTRHLLSALQVHSLLGKRQSIPGAQTLLVLPELRESCPACALLSGENQAQSLLLPHCHRQVGSITFLRLFIRNCPGNSFKSSSGRLGQEQSKPFGTSCDKPTAQSGT